jgi:hypothetical protein
MIKVRVLQCLWLNQGWLNSDDHMREDFLLNEAGTIERLRPEILAKFVIGTTAVAPSIRGSIIEIHPLFAEDGTPETDNKEAWRAAADRRVHLIYGVAVP